MSYYLVLKDNLPVEVSLNRAKAYDMAKHWYDGKAIVEVVEVVRKSEWQQLELQLEKGHGDDCREWCCKK